MSNKPLKLSISKYILFLILYFLYALIVTHSANEVYYVQSPKTKLLSNPKMNADGASLPIGTSLKKMSESGLFYQVRFGEKTGYVSKLFISSFPPGKQIKLGTTNSSNEQALGRQRASDFTKTAAARGLSETEKLRVRGSSDDFDFESLRWLENLGQSTIFEKQIESIVTDNSNDSYFLQFYKDSHSKETQAEVKMGRVLSAKLIKKYGLIKNEELTLYLNKLGQSIVNITSRQDLSFRFGILDSDEINAFACPGGFIFITKAALVKTSNESELIGILSHEISHVILDHHEKIESDNAFLEILSSLLATPSIEIVSTATLTALESYEQEFFEKGRNIDTELEADESSIQLMNLLGYSPHNFIKYLQNISNTTNQNTILKTHPSSIQRIKKIETQMNSMNNIIELKISNDEYLRVIEKL